MIVDRRQLFRHKPPYRLLPSVPHCPFRISIGASIGEREEGLVNWGSWAAFVLAVTEGCMPSSPNRSIFLLFTRRPSEMQLIRLNSVVHA
jgi:hypothetical protein